MDQGFYKFISWISIFEDSHLVKVSIQNGRIIVIVKEESGNAYSLTLHRKLTGIHAICDTKLKLLLCRESDRHPGKVTPYFKVNSEELKLLQGIVA
jgi:hypothetical protein